MTQQEQSEYTQLIILSQKHTEQIERITKDCTQAVDKLNRSMEEFKRVKSWQDWLRIFIPLLAAILILFSAAFIPCNTNLKFAGAEISRICPAK